MLQQVGWNGFNMTIGRAQMTKQVEGQLRGARKNKAPKGYHYMPNGRLMKDSAHVKKKQNSNRSKV
jgi:hypothetical protein